MLLLLLLPFSRLLFSDLLAFSFLFEDGKRRAKKVSYYLASCVNIWIVIQLLFQLLLQF